MTHLTCVTLYQIGCIRVPVDITVRPILQYSNITGVRLDKIDFARVELDTSPAVQNRFYMYTCRFWNVSYCWISRSQVSPLISEALHKIDSTRVTFETCHKVKKLIHTCLSWLVRLCTTSITHVSQWAPVILQELVSTRVTSLTCHTVYFEDVIQ